MYCGSGGREFGEQVAPGELEKDVVVGEQDHSAISRPVIRMRNTLLSSGNRLQSRFAASRSPITATALASGWRSLRAALAIG